MQFNEYQTQLTEELLASLHKEEREELLEALIECPFIHNLVKPDREKAKDRPRDSKGRIIVDIVNPHIIEDMDYFRQAALHFKREGCYTHLKPNPNPNSEYGKWFRREVNRCWYGMYRPSDGEWIPGKLYFYWNYALIALSRVIEGTTIADRVDDFPEPWELSYLWAHYEHQSRYGGLYDDFKGGKDSGIISRRGAGKSFYKASTLARLFVVGDNQRVQRNVRGMIVAYEKEYLNRDGTLNKFQTMIDFLADNTQFPSSRVRDSLTGMNWKMGYIEAETGLDRGTLNEVLGISAKDNPDKVRGKRCVDLIYEEFGVFPKFIETWGTSEFNVREGDYAFGSRSFVGCVCAGTKVRTSEGVEVNIEDLKQSDGILGYDIHTDSISKEPITYMQEPAYKECVRLVTNNRILECSIDHPILVRKTVSKRLEDYKIGDKRSKWFEYEFIEAGKLQAANRLGLVICEAPLLNFGQMTLFDPYLVGLLIGDGSYGSGKTPLLSNCDVAILEYVKSRYNCVVEREHITSTQKIYQEVRIKGICPKLREIGIYGQTKLKKTLPVNYKDLSSNDTAELLAGLFDTDGTIGNGKSNTLIELSSSSKILLKQVKELLIKFGIASRIYKVKARIGEGRKDKNDWFKLSICSRGDITRFKKYIPIKVSYKILNLEKLSTRLNKPYYHKENTRIELLHKVEPIGVRRVYNLTAGNTNTYIANGIVTHNTGGTEGSNFEGAMAMITSPAAHSVYGIPNVFDKSNKTQNNTILFLGGYLNRKGFYNKDGVSDVVGALISIIKQRYTIKYNSTDPNTITKFKAEIPIYLQEAIMRRDSTIYPTSDLLDRIMEIDADPKHWDKLWTGRLKVEGGDVTYEADDSFTVLKDFPHTSNKLEGSICIHKMPVTTTSRKPPRGRYIGGIDTFDDDESETLSLGCIYIMDLFTDELVFEYTGRGVLADNFYEICRRALLFYNAEANYENNKKGLFKYFSQYNSLYLLSDTLSFLKDVEDVKITNITNKTKGTNATGHTKKYARRCIRDWLVRPVTILKPIIDPETNIESTQEQKVMGLYKIPFRALLRELALWTNDGNFDRHDALGMLMLLREDKLRFVNINNFDQRSDEAGLAEDSYFSKNWKPT